MQTYANALLIAIPGFMVLILIEAIYGALKGRQTLNGPDTISSLSSGITNVIKDSLGLVLVLVSYPFLVEHLALMEIKSSWVVYLLAFIAIDFAGYWTHRLSHTVNVFWNRHLVHHSSEEFNLPCALRQSISNLTGFYALFLIPAALLGIPNEVIALLAPIHLFMQFWYHTRHIPKLGWLEYIIITPSQHRVHHAINPEYLDKNLGQIFSIWDRLFGTFQEELEDVPPVYGITRPVRTWNPIKINFLHLGLLIRDAWHTKNWWDKLRIWFMPLGWRPPDVVERFPVYKIEDVYHFEKYKPENSRALTAWSWIQLVMSTLLLLWMFFKFTDIGTPGLYLYGAILFTGIYGFTALMDQDRWAWVFEMIRGLAGFGVVVWTGDWFLLGSSAPGLQWVVAAYFLASAAGGLFFTLTEILPAKKTAAQPIPARN